MSQYTILWVDDDINNPELRSDKLALEMNDAEIVGIDNSDEFFDYIEDSDKDPTNIDCIIVDLSMAPGWKLRTEKTDYGVSTGLFLLKRIKESQFKDTLTIVYTITDNPKVKSYCKTEGIPYWTKIELSPFGFADNVIREINEKRIQVGGSGTSNV